MLIFRPLLDSNGLSLVKLISLLTNNKLFPVYILHSQNLHNILEKAVVYIANIYPNPKNLQYTMKNVFFISFLSLLVFSPVFMTGAIHKTDPATYKTDHHSINALSSVSTTVLYDSLNLREMGLNKKAFEFAWRGFLRLVEKGKLINTDYLTIADFSQSSRNKRLYIIDLKDMTVFKNTYVVHGRNSGGEFAKTFSNRPESHKSSLGFYITRNVYFGQHGMSLQIDGLEKGINDRALARRIVVHGAEYIGDQFLEANPFTGRSYGCPAVPSSERDEIINTIKDGTCIFIYHPSQQYLTRSRILNG